MEQPTVKEIAHETELPPSTVYRKIRKVSDTPWIRQKVGLRGDGQHTQKYELAFEELKISVTEEEFEIEQREK